MADKPVNKKTKPENTETNQVEIRHITINLQEENYSWIIFFTLASWILISIAFITGFYKFIILSADPKYSREESDNIIKTTIVEQKTINPQTKKNKEYYLSDKNNMGSGQLTKKEGFQSMSASRELRLEAPDENQISKPEYDEKAIAELSNQFITRILKSIPENKTREQVSKKFSKTTIPFNYKYSKEFIFSWDANGQPVIPTVAYKHFSYFKNMLDKIQKNWSPPGGTPYPTYENGVSDEIYTPGRATYRVFPDQAVQIVFTIDASGDVHDIKLWKSMGFESLDRACIDAIERSRNFGSPPKELMENEILIVPMIFRF